MPRYIDADALIKKLFPYDVVDKKCYSINAEAVYKGIETTQTADVAPSSEADEIAKELSDTIVMKDELFDEVVRLRKVLDAYEETSGLKQAKAEYAREIFTEIEFDINNLDFDREETRAIAIEGIIANAKKRFTEEQQ